MLTGITTVKVTTLLESYRWSEDVYWGLVREKLEVVFLCSQNMSGKLCLDVDEVTNGKATKLRNIR